eukprot:1160252-Pelagomonas_calceolata.AAC.2
MSGNKGQSTASDTLAQRAGTSRTCGDHIVVPPTPRRVVWRVILAPSSCNCTMLSTSNASMRFHG